MEYTLRVPKAIYGDLVPVGLVCEAMAKAQATGYGELTFDKRTYDAVRQMRMDDVSSDVRAGALVVLDSRGNRHQNPTAFEPTDVYQAVVRRPTLMAWAAERGDTYTVIDVGVCIYETPAGRVLIADELVPDKLAKTAPDSKLSADEYDGVMPATENSLIFKEMRGLRPSELSFAFVGDQTESGLGANNMFEIAARGQRRRVPLASLDLVNKTTGGPNGECGILLGLALGEKLKTSTKNASKMKRLRHVFLHRLGITEDPFHPYLAATGWVPLFKIFDRRGAADNRAKREAEERTDSFESLHENGRQFVAAPDQQHIEADYWMKENGHKY